MQVRTEMEICMNSICERRTVIVLTRENGGLWLADLVTVLSGWTLRSSRTGQTNRTLDAVATSRTLRPFLALKEQGHLL